MAYVPFISFCFSSHASFFFFCSPLLLWHCAFRCCCLLFYCLFFFFTSDLFVLLQALVSCLWLSLLFLSLYDIKSNRENEKMLLWNVQGNFSVLDFSQQRSAGGLSEENGERSVSPAALIKKKKETYIYIYMHVVRSATYERWLLFLLFSASWADDSCGCCCNV